MIWRAAPRTAVVLLALSLATAPLGGCRTARKPIPRSADQGPSVELVQPERERDKDRPAVALIAEREPDNDRDHAQPIDRGKGIRGTIAPSAGGQEQSGQGDEDWYSYLAQGDGSAEGASGAQELKLMVSSEPGQDLTLDLFDGDGKRLIGADVKGGGNSDQSAVASLVIKVGQTIYVRVRGKDRPPGGRGAPGGNRYELAIKQIAAPAGSETEPNDTQQTATLATGMDLSGTLSSAKDEDWFLIPLGDADADPDPGADPTPAGKSEGKPGLIKPGPILRVELSTPGVTPALRVVLPGNQEKNISPTPIVDVHAAPGVTELRLRNVGLQGPATQVLLGIRSLSWHKTAADSRYQLHVTSEPPLEGAEQEPNDDCTRADRLPAGRGFLAEGGLAGFLWPGDVDCYEVRVDVPSTVSFQLDLPTDDSAEGGGCNAELALVSRPPSVSVFGDAPPPTLLSATVPSVRDRVLVRVIQKGKRGCYDAPYHLTARVEPEAKLAP